MKTIIVATDYSMGSESALKYASFIARFSNCKIALLNVFHLSTHAMNGLISPAAVESLIQENNAKMQDYAKKASSKYNVAITGYCFSGIIEDAVQQLVQTLNAGLVLLGMRGNSREEKLVGRTCTTIINNTRVPALIIPPGVEFKMPEKLLFACDYQSLPKESDLSVLRDIARTFDAEIQVFHVGKSADLATVNVEQGAEIVQGIEDSIGELNHTYKDFDSEDVITGIEQGIKDFNADVLVMSPHKYGFFSSIFHKSTTCAMAFRTNIPLLSLPS